MELTPFYQLGVSIGLGLLVGLQRQFVQQSVAGFRTFPLIALAGTLSAQVGADQSIWVISAGLITIAILLVLGNVARIQAGHLEAGLTTEFAAVVMYLVGALVVVQPMAIAVAVGGAVALLLHFKESLHGFADRITDMDIRAIMQFALISMVILPVLPNRDFGPYGALNPFEIWLMVVLIVAIGLSGYVAYKLVGERTGTLLSGILGGIVSSTATTVSYARRGRYYPDAAGLNALVVMLASTVMFVRIFVELGIVAGPAIADLAPPLAALFAFNLLVCAAAYTASRRLQTAVPPQENPAELKPALIFGAVYAAVLFTVAAARHHLGDTGLYAVAAISGLPNVDALTLSVGNLIKDGQITPQAGWRAIVIAVIANLAFKAGVVAALGGRAMFLAVGSLLGTSIAGALAVLVLWP